MVLFNKVNVVKNRFKNGEKQYFDLSEFLRYSPRNIITLIYENNEDLFDLAIIKKWFDDNSINNAKIELIAEFCPYCYQDKKMNGFMFGFKYFAHFINSLNFDQVTIYDSYSSITEAVINKCYIEYPMKGVNLETYDLMFYPDNETAKKYSEIYNKLYYFGNKEKNLDTGKVDYYKVVADKKDIENKKILIRDCMYIDDNTFKEAAKALNEMGAAQVDLYITHLTSSAKDFFINYKSYGITNFYSENTLRQDWYK